MRQHPFATVLEALLLTVFHVHVPFLLSDFLIILLTVLLVHCLCHVHWTAEVAVGALCLY